MPSRAAAGIGPAIRRRIASVARAGIDRARLRRARSDRRGLDQQQALAGERAEEAAALQGQQGDAPFFAATDELREKRRERSEKQ
jgi:hypothetical protein